MGNKWISIIFLVGFITVAQVNTQKWLGTVENKIFDVLGMNYIDASSNANNTLQPATIQKQLKTSQINSGDRGSVRETVNSKEYTDEELLKIFLNNLYIDDFDKLNLIGDRVISQANVSEETKRVAREVKKKRPGFFWTVFRAAFETFNETKSAIHQINEIIDANILPDTTTRQPSLKLTTSTPKIIANTVNVSNATTMPVKIKKMPYKLTRNKLQNIVRRNIQGLVRLFNIEWRDAINESQISIKEFQKALGKSAAPFLADN